MPHQLYNSTITGFSTSQTNMQSSTFLKSTATKKAAVNSAAFLLPGVLPVNHHHATTSAAPAAHILWRFAQFVSKT